MRGTDIPILVKVTRRYVTSFTVPNPELVPEEFLKIDYEAISDRLRKSKKKIPGIIVKRQWTGYK